MTSLHSHYSTADAGEGVPTARSVEDGGKNRQRTACGSLGLSTAHIPPEEGNTRGKVENDGAKLEVWRGASRVKVSHEKIKVTQFGGGIRGKVGLFSRQSKKRLMDLLSTLDKQEKPLFLTLTYPAEWANDSKVWKKDLENFCKRMTRKYSKSSLIWKLEPQKRGAPHYHLMVWGLTYYQLLCFASTAWYEVVGSGDEKHLQAGTRVERIRSWRGVRSYAAKYLGKIIEKLQKEEQEKKKPEEKKILCYDVLTREEMEKRERLENYNRMTDKLFPEEEEETGWSSPGRFWGVKGRKNLPVVVSKVLEILSEKQVFDIMRLMRRYSGIKGRSYRSLSIVCNDPAQWERVLLL